MVPPMVRPIQACTDAVLFGISNMLALPDGQKTVSHDAAHVRPYTLDC